MALLLAACEPAPRPWQAPPDGGVVDESKPYLPPRHDGPLLGDAAAADPDAGGGGFGTTPQHRREGGLWAGCHAGFQPPAEPLAGVTRLGLLCGPANGMRRQGKTFQGQVGPGADGASQHRMRAAADACYRVVAVASPEVEQWEVSVESSRGTRVAAGKASRRWLVIDPDRPFCSFANDDFTVRIASGRGRGRYALEVWELR